MSGLAEPSKTDYVHRLRSTAEAHREQHGFPHWVIYDEAQLLGADEQAHWARRGGYVLCSFAPASLPAHEIDSSDIVLTLTNADTAADIDSRRRATIRFGSGPPRGFTIADRHTAHVRHRHKYADIRLPPERRFYFHTTDGRTIAAAATMHDFSTAVIISTNKHSNTISNAATFPTGWTAPSPTRTSQHRWLAGRTSYWRIAPPTWNAYATNSSTR